MVANKEKKKKVKTKKVFEKAKGWEDVGKGDNVALFKSERGSFYAVMGRTKFYLRAAQGKGRRMKL